MFVQAHTTTMRTQLTKTSIDLRIPEPSEQKTYKRKKKAVIKDTQHKALIKRSTFSFLFSLTKTDYAKLLKRQNQQRLQGQDPEQIQLNVPMFTHQRALPPASTAASSSEGAQTKGRSKDEDQVEEMEVISGDGNSSSIGGDGPEPMDQDDRFASSSSSSSPPYIRQHSYSGSSSSPTSTTFQQQQQPKTQPMPVDSIVVPPRTPSDPTPEI